MDPGHTCICGCPFGTAYTKPTDFGNFVQLSYCWQCNRFAPLVKTNMQGEMTMVDFYDSQVPVWTTMGWHTSEQLIQMKQTSLDNMTVVHSDDEEELADLPCFYCKDMIGQIQADRDGYQQVVPYCWFCHHLQPVTQVVANVPVTRSFSQNDAVYDESGNVTTPYCLMNRDLTSMLLMDFVPEGKKEEEDKTLVYQRPILVDGPAFPTQASAYDLQNFCLGQDYIGMLGGSNSKGDGPSSKDSGAGVFSRRSKHHKDANSESENSESGKSEHDLNLQGPPQEKKKKVWKEKKGGSRSNKGNNLVAAQMAKDIAKLQGEKDAMHELVQDVLQNSNSPNSPPPSPELKSPEKPKKNPVHHLPTDLVEIDFFVSTPVRSVGLLLHLAVLSLQFLLVIYPLATETLAWKSLYGDHYTPIFFWSLWRVMIGLWTSPMSLLTLANIVPHLLIFSGMMAYALAYKVNLYSRKRGHWYHSVSPVQSQKNDARADVLSLGDIKHPEPLIHKVGYHHSTLWSSKYKELTVSMELLAQISTSINLDLAYTEELAWQHIRHSANHFQSVNLDRYEVLRNNYVVQHTGVVAFGLWKHMQQESAEMLFPRSQ